MIGEFLASNLGLSKIKLHVSLHAYTINYYKEVAGQSMSGRWQVPGSWWWVAVWQVVGISWQVTGVFFTSFSGHRPALRECA